MSIHDPQWHYSSLGLSNLAQLCHQHPSSRWQSIINNHFDSMQQTSAFESGFYKKAHDYEYASSYIGVRLYPADYIAHIGEEAIIKRNITDDLIAMLVFDFPHGVCNIKPETTIQWNKTNEELFEIGRANIRKNYTSETMSEDFNGIKIWIITGDHFFVTNSLLDLHLESIPSGAHGALIGVPHRHTLMVYPIDNLEVVTAIQPFVYVLQGLFKEGPGSLSENLYWYRNGELTTLPYSLEADSLNFSPPETFLDVLNILPKKK